MLLQSDIKSFNEKLIIIYMNRFLKIENCKAGCDTILIHWSSNKPPCGYSYLSMNHVCFSHSFAPAEGIFTVFPCCWRMETKNVRSNFRGGFPKCVFKGTCTWIHTAASSQTIEEKQLPVDIKGSMRDSMVVLSGLQ